MLLAIWNLVLRLGEDGTKAVPLGSGRALSDRRDHLLGHRVARRRAGVPAPRRDDRAVTKTGPHGDSPDGPNRLRIETVMQNEAPAGECRGFSV